jgi:glycosyltransferase involved in cell wall biosynthesis
LEFGAAKMKKLAIITTHPIQYYAPIFRLLHERGNLDIKVFYTLGKAGIDKYDPDFKQKVSWDIPLTDGYPIEWVDNASENPGSATFGGIINPQLIKQINHWQPDALLVYGWANKSHLKLMRYFKGKVPVYFRGDSTLLDNTTWFKKKLRWLFLNWVYSFVDHAFYTGTNNFNYYKNFGLKDGQLSFAPHAVDNERFYAGRSAEVTLLRQNLGLNTSNILILFAGKLEEKKDPLLLLDAFLRLTDKNVHLLFVGNGHLQELLMAKAKNNTNVHFIDFQNQTQMPVVYQACDLFCLPSKGPGETWGLAVNEAMACGKPVLVSDKVGCAVDLVKPGVNGYILKNGDLDSLYTCLKELTVSQKKMQEYGKQSADIIKGWSFTKIAEAIENRFLNREQPPEL